MTLPPMPIGAVRQSLDRCSGSRALFVNRCFPQSVQHGLEKLLIPAQDHLEFMVVRV